MRLFRRKHRCQFPSGTITLGDCFSCIECGTEWEFRRSWVDNAYSTTGRPGWELYWEKVTSGEDATA